MATVNPAATAVALLADRMYQGYYAQVATLYVATLPGASALAPSVGPSQTVPVGRVYRKSGTYHAFHFNYYLDWARNHPIVSEDLQRVWIVGALLQVGDALAAHHYFDRAPELELVRHLRNGVAHGNKFNIANSVNLARYPAHNKFANVREVDFEISPALHGSPVLFDFMGPADCLDLLQSVGIYLHRMGAGLPRLT
jgi:hypothetical protein